MNERLKQHIESNFKDWDKNSHGALFDEEGHLVSLERIKTECKYFYRIALEDVRKEVERKIESHTKRQNTVAVVTLRDLMNFIDQLSK